MKILITGAAGFIGFHLVKRLLEHSSYCIMGVDNMNNYYDASLKYARLRECGIPEEAKEWGQIITSSKHKKYRFVRLDINNKVEINNLFQKEKFDLVCHLAAQAGVRYSLQNPDVYLQSNIIGFGHILESCKANNVTKLLYASSSSVYGNNKNSPNSLYAVTKKTNELMAHVYSDLFDIQTIGMRFFSVYGEWGRPDMALYSFTKSIKENKIIKVFNDGNMYRSFTYINDVTVAIHLLINKVLQKRMQNNFELLDIGNSESISLHSFINIIEARIGKRASIEYLPLQKGDVLKTQADNTRLKETVNFEPNTNVKNGVKNFMAWYDNFYDTESN